MYYQLLTEIVFLLRLNHFGLVENCSVMNGQVEFNALDNVSNGGMRVRLQTASQWGGGIQESTDRSFFFTEYRKVIRERFEQYEHSDRAKAYLLLEDTDFPNRLANAKKLVRKYWPKLPGLQIKDTPFAHVHVFTPQNKIEQQKLIVDAGEVGMHFSLDFIYDCLKAFVDESIFNEFLEDCEEECVSMFMCLLEQAHLLATADADSNMMHTAHISPNLIMDAPLSWF